MEAQKDNRDIWEASPESSQTHRTFCRCSQKAGPVPIPFRCDSFLNKITQARSKWPCFSYLPKKYNYVNKKRMKTKQN